MIKPKFLIVGAMKSATTTLFEDLATHPLIFAPDQKEPRNLCSEIIMTDEGLRAYTKLFDQAKPNQLAFEASTHYTMRPDHEYVAHRARSILGDNLKVIYVVRDPVSRSISHHAHAYAAGDCTANINEEIYRFKRLINYSKYYYQIEPWLTALGKPNVFILTQEYYVSNRRHAVGALQSFLGLKPCADLIDAHWVGNSRAALAQDTTVSRIFRSSSFYKSGIRPLLSPSVRGRWKRLLMKKVARPATEATAETRAHIAAETREDIAQLEPYVRLKEPGGWV